MSFLELAKRLSGRLPDEADEVPAAVGIIPVSADAATTITLALRDGGWIGIYSQVLGEEILLVRDEAVMVPGAQAGLPRFDLEELAVLAAERPSPERLRAIVDVKREMPGTRVVADSGKPTDA